MSMGFVPGGSEMNYSAVVASPAAFGAGAALPHEGVLWLVARLMLDSAGGLFGLYLLAIFGLFLAGHVMRSRDRISGPVRSRIGAPADTSVAGPGT
jgi:hypothetical protein